MRLNLIIKPLLVTSLFALVGCVTKPMYSERSITDYQRLSEQNCESLVEDLSLLVRDFRIANDDGNKAGAGMSTGAVGSLLAGAGYSVTLPAALAGGLFGLVYQKFYEDRNLAERDYIDGLLATYNGKGCADSVVTQSPAFAKELIQRALVGRLATHVGDIETLPFPNRCTNANDNIRRSYFVFLSGLQPGERLRFFTRGSDASSRSVLAASLLLGELRLPPMSITARRGGKKRGLWVERLVTGERFQLNHLPVALHCSTRGLLTVKYNNIWVRVVPANEIY